MCLKLSTSLNSTDYFHETKYKCKYKNTMKAAKYFVVLHSLESLILKWNQALDFV